jgi:mRNA-degrading endonuclease RelE of RelBE toxin-antitoxin system
MHYLDRLFVGPEYETCVWISQKAGKFLTKQARRHDKAISELLDKVEFWAKNGFANWEGGDGHPIKHEGDGVYRLGRRSSLFRLIGFYENDDKQSFLIIDAFLKLKQESARHEKERMRGVALIKKTVGAWQKTGE